METSRIHYYIDLLVVVQLGGRQGCMHILTALYILSYARVRDRIIAVKYFKLGRNCGLTAHVISDLVEDKNHAIDEYLSLHFDYKLANRRSLRSLYVRCCFMLLKSPGSSYLRCLQEVK